MHIWWVLQAFGPYYQDVFVALVSGGSGIRLHDGPDLKLFILVAWDRSFRQFLGPPGLN